MEARNMKRKLSYSSLSVQQHNAPGEVIHVSHLALLCRSSLEPACHVLMLDADYVMTFAVGLQLTTPDCMHDHIQACAYHAGDFFRGVFFLGEVNMSRIVTVAAVMVLK